LPPDDRQQRLLEDIRGRLHVLDMLNPFGRGFMDIFGGYDDDYDDEDDVDF
jgi:hypothetical protein